MRIVRRARRVARVFVVRALIVRGAERARARPPAGEARCDAAARRAVARSAWARRGGLDRDGGLAGRARGAAGRGP